ncbi:MAG: tRNA-dihydrouridine synthase [Clostridia bacterium]|nr:tRNA-dihydrouridine synthase [Clostridia bacterium]
MQLCELTIGNTQVRNNIFLAPMAGYTDYAIRKLQIDMGAGLTFTELVSAKGLVFGGKNNNTLIYSGDNKDKTAVQLFGADPYYMRSACESDYLRDFSIIDINMGCPVPKVYKNGEGSALLKDIKKAESVVKECVKSGKTITVKIRTGLKYGDDIASEYAKMAENSGAKLITVHGRVREAYYSGEPDYKAIEKAKHSVKIPVIANGGIFTESDADKMLEQTGADGVMIARGAIADPFLIARLTNTEHKHDLKSYILEHLTLSSKIYTDHTATVEFRKFVPYYFKGISGVKDLKLALCKANDLQELRELIEKGV